MFGQSKPIVFEPYGRRRSRRLLPRWLALMLGGVAIGAGGVFYVQERYLPPRLSVDESTRLHAAFEQADAERVRLQGELADTTKGLQQALADKNGLAAEVKDGRETVARLREDIGSLVASLPPDPRNGAVAVRAARFGVKGTTLTYEVVVSRERPGGDPLAGVLQFVVAGTSGRGPEGTVALKPVPISVDRYDSVRGALPLPEGFKPRRATVQVLDKAGGKLLGMRVLNVN